MRKYFKRNHEYFTFLEKNKNNIREEMSYGKYFNERH